LVADRANGVGGVLLLLGVGADEDEPAPAEYLQSEVAAAVGPFVVLLGEDRATSRIMLVR
jgi:hypothetical protein